MASAELVLNIKLMATSMTNSCYLPPHSWLTVYSDMSFPRFAPTPHILNPVQKPQFDFPGYHLTGLQLQTRNYSSPNILQTFLTHISILVGEYSPDEAECKTNCRLFRFPINSATRLLTLTSPSGNPNVKVAVATEVVQHKRTKTQGGISIDKRFYLTQSGGNLITWNGNVNSQDKLTPAFFPTLPQDLSYKRNKGELWTLTEPADARWVFGFNPKKV